MIARLLFVLLVCCSASLMAQPDELKFEHLTKEHGLSSSDITSIVQDKLGFIWIGTIDGLNRYDGYSIKTYRNIPEEAGSLGDNKISVLYVDRQGELWIGTEKGLSRYNRAADSFVHYPYNPFDSQSLSFHYVTSIVEDTEDNLWIGTLSGLNRFDRKTQAFTQYLKKISIAVTPQTLQRLKERRLPAEVLAALTKLQNRQFSSGEIFLGALKQTLSAKHLKEYQSLILESLTVETTADGIRSMAAGKNGTLWLGFEQQGLGHFNPVQEESLERFSHSDTNSNTLSNNELLSLEVDGDQLWIGTRGGGLNRFDTRRRLFYRYPYTRETVHIKSILKDSSGKLWFGDSEGLNLYMEATDSFYRFRQSADEDQGLTTLFVSALFEDAQGNLWVGCDQGGVNMATLHQSFKHLTHKAGQPGSLTKKSVSSVLEDSKGNLWVGYFSQGIDFWDAATNTKTHFSHSAEDPYSVGHGTVFKIFEDSKGKIWVGTYKGGLQYFDPTSKRFHAYKHDPSDAESIGRDDVRDIEEDKQGNLWIAVHGGGVSKFNRQTNTFTNYKADGANWKSSLSSDWVYTVFCDSRGRIWAGSVNGVSVLEPGKKDFISYNQSNSKLSHNNVRTIFADRQGQIWVGTENGLNQFNEQERGFKVYTERNGLPNNFIMGGVADEKGNLWISTNGGLSKFMPETGQFHNYSKLDGLQSNEFFPGAYYKSSKGEIFFGGKGGLNVFTPDQIKDNPYKTPVVISDFRLFNQQVPVGEESSPLQKEISLAEEIRLSHDQNVISFGFVGLNYVRPEKNQYAYMMQGFEENWNYVGNKREATYTNLDPGEYVFRVKASNNDGLWNEEGTSIRVIVQAPWWQTSWAYAAYALVLLLLLLTGRHIMLRRAQVRFEREQERREASQLHELDLMKIRFLTNVSHEFRTPLSLILAPLDKLLAQSTQDPQQQKQYLMIQRNAKRLLNLVNQLLDFRKLEVQGINFYPSEGNIIKFISGTVSSFSDLSEKKGVSLTFESNVEELQASFDMDKLEKILFNLLSNAFKFTDESGTITVTVDCQQNDSASEGLKILHISVKDTGIGIPRDKHEKIFERFFRNELPRSLVNQGSGIGLAITKEFVKIHGGTIRVDSELGKGSCFTVSLPVKEIISSKNTAPAAEQLLMPAEEVLLPRETLSAHKAVAGGEKKPEVLLIEDNEDFRLYLRENLSQYFTITEAPNGKEGWQKALSSMPDLIVSDLMMPEMNGIDLCRKVKQDARTSHIPFVLLTAHTAEEQKLKGLDIGANDYITKPFNFEMLLSRLRNLIAQRQLMQQTFEKKISVETSQVEIISMDDKLIQRAIQLVEEHLEDPDFSVEQLSRELGMSRAHLYKKMVSITGISPVEFIRKIRLQRAAQFLEKSQLSVAEVAYKVGFNNTKYFSKYFKAAYNQLPSQYAGNKSTTLE